MGVVAGPRGGGRVLLGAEEAFEDDDLVARPEGKRSRAVVAVALHEVGGLLVAILAMACT
jgi:hypothetical protein